MGARSKKKEDECETRNAIVDKMEIPIDVKKKIEDSFGIEHRIYYKKVGDYVTCACSHENATQRFRFKNFATLESMSEISCDEEIKHNRYGKCPVCGKKGKFIAIGKRKHNDEINRCDYIFQKIDYDNVVIRYFESYMSYDYTDMGGLMPMEHLEMLEVARIHLPSNRKESTDYNKYYGYSNKTYWDYKNLYGMNNITLYEGPMHHEGIIDNTFLKYNSYDLVKNRISIGHYKPGTLDYIRYLKTYTRYPIVEMFAKCGMTNMISSLIYAAHPNFDMKKKKPWDIMKISKERFNDVKRKNQKMSEVRLYQFEKRANIKFKDEHIKEFIRQYELPDERIFEYTTVEKYVNHIKNYRKQNVTVNTIHIYNDYFSMRIHLGYDMHNSIFLFPKDLKQKHDEMVAEQNIINQRTKMTDNEKKYPNIKKQYEQLNAFFEFKDKEFCIRPVNSATEMMIEGATMHHCVGGDNYLSKHNTGKSYILLLRHTETADKAYCTIEIDAETGKIKQWYQAYDKKPDAEILQPWINKYQSRIQNRMKQIEQPVLMAAAM